MSRRRGNHGENLFMAMAEELGYATFAARGSRGPIDVLAFERRDHMAAGLFGGDSTMKLLNPFRLAPLVVQVGTGGKPVAATLAALDAAPRPIGSLCVVARRMPLKAGKRSWRFHTPYGTFTSLREALDAR